MRISDVFVSEIFSLSCIVLRTSEAVTIGLNPRSKSLNVTNRISIHKTCVPTLLQDDAMLTRSCSYRPGRYQQYQFISKCPACGTGKCRI
jgi:hypothetical protein